MIGEAAEAAGAANMDAAANDIAGGVASWRLSALVALVALGLIVALIPQQPGVTALLAAADQQRAAFRYDRALALDAAARAEDPGDPRPICAQGQILLLQRETAAAISAYQTCAALAPDDASAWLALGDALDKQATAALRAGDPPASDSAAANAWSHAARLGSDDAWERLAERDERLGMLTEAASAWSRVSVDSAQAELAAAHLGLLALARGDSRQAQLSLLRLTHANDALATQLRTNGVFLFAGFTPTQASDWLGIGHALLAMNMPAAALGPLRRATTLDPGDSAAHAYYGYALWALGQREAARSQIAAGLTGRAVLPFAWYAAGLEALRDGASAQALTDFQNGALSDPRNPVLWSAAGDAAVATGQYLVAELSYQNAAQYSDTPGATITLVQFYFDYGLGFDDGTALQTAHAGLLRFPGNEPLAFLEGLIYQKQGEANEAQALFAYAQQLDPTDPGPWYYIGSAAASAELTENAIVELRAAIALQPGGPYAAKARVLLATLTPTTNL